MADQTRGASGGVRLCFRFGAGRGISVEPRENAIRAKVDLAKAALNSLEWGNLYQVSSALFLAIDSLQSARQMVETKIEDE